MEKEGRPLLSTPEEMNGVVSSHRNSQGDRQAPQIVLAWPGKDHGYISPLLSLKLRTKGRGALSKQMLAARFSMHSSVPTCYRILLTELAYPTPILNSPRGWTEFLPAALHYIFQLSRLPGPFVRSLGPGCHLGYQLLFRLLARLCTPP